MRDIRLVCESEFVGSDVCTTLFDFERVLGHLSLYSMRMPWYGDAHPRCSPAHFGVGCPCERQYYMYVGNGSKLLVLCYHVMDVLVGKEWVA
jgi:hypothetical protein